MKSISCSSESSRTLTPTCRPRSSQPSSKLSRQTFSSVTRHADRSAVCLMRAHLPKPDYISQSPLPPHPLPPQTLFLWKRFGPCCCYLRCQVNTSRVRRLNVAVGVTLSHAQHESATHRQTFRGPNLASVYVLSHLDRCPRTRRSRVIFQTVAADRESTLLSRSRSRRVISRHRIRVLI